MRTQATLLTIIVALALSGGLAAFLLANPDQGRRPTGADLGFGRLEPSAIERGVANAAAHHEAAHRTLLGGGAAARTAKGWLAVLPGSRARPAVLARQAKLVPRDPQARTRLDAFVRWADDLPRATWTAAVGSTMVESGAT